MKTTCLDGLWRTGRDFLGSRYPLMCGAMTWISDAALVKAVNDQGGFGCLAAGNMPGEMLAAEIEKCAKLTDKPFAVNLVTIAPNFPAHKEAVLKSKAPAGMSGISWSSSSSHGIATPSASRSFSPCC